MSGVTHELECHVTRELSGDRYFCCCAELRIREADHLAALERVRVETLREAREAVLGPLMHDDACCSRGCTQQHWTEWDSRQRGLAVLGLPVADLSTRPESRCDESCNCTAAPFAAAIDRLIDATTLPPRSNPEPCPPLNTTVTWHGSVWINDDDSEPDLFAHYERVRFSDQPQISVLRWSHMAGARPGDDATTTGDTE